MAETTVPPNSSARQNDQHAVWYAELQGPTRRWRGLTRRILVTPPRSLQGCAVVLRLVLDLTKHSQLEEIDRRAVRRVIRHLASAQSPRP